nr:helitron helicase-like domain-containing protein [Tanacetum cinerariifolium]
MKTKRKLLPKSIPTAGDSTIDFSAAVDRISNVNSNVSTKKQRLCSSNSVLFVAAAVGPSGVDNIVHVDANVVSYPPNSHSFPMSQNVDANILANTGTSQPGPTLEGCRTTSVVGPPSEYKHIGNCVHSCEHCGALFWFEERLKDTPTGARPRYNRCCRTRRVALRTYQIYPEYIKMLLNDRHFLENIRAYNQMLSMTSLGVNIDETINNGRGPYVFKISGQLYHWIGSLCPADGDPPHFLQLYIYDTDNEVDNRLTHFGGSNVLRMDIVEGLIDLLDTHNALVQLFRTTREKFQDDHIPNFKVRLYNVIGAREYELPAGDTLGAIVYKTGPDNDMDYDIMLETRGLSHCHTLLWIDESVRVHRDDDIDNYASAELPFRDIDPEGYRVVLELMMHGPCGLANPSDVYGKYWRRSRISTKSSIGRLTYVHPASGDLFYERMLLCHQKGCTSFPDIRIVNDIVYSTCREACEALGLLENDQEWEIILEEAKLTATPVELPALLAHILAYCQVSDPKRLWKPTWKSISEDISYVYSISLNLLGKIALDVASSGIASLQLPAGHTAHSRFKIPLDLTDTSECAIKKNTQMADLLKETCLIVWDEQMATTSDPHNMAATKGKMIAIEPKVSNIVGLNPGDSNKIIEAIVYRKWVSKHIQTQQPIRFCCILMDKQGTPIQANMDAKDTEYFDQLLELYAAYRITCFHCEHTLPWERTLDNPTSLTFRKFISLQQIPNNDFPEHYFNFSSYNDLPAKLHIQNPVLTGIQLSGTSANHYYLNLNLLETYHIKEHDIKTWNKKRTETASLLPLSSKLILKTTSYCFKAIIGDRSGTISLTCFSNQANSLTRDCTKVLVELPDKNPYQLPPNLKNLEGAHHKHSYASWELSLGYASGACWLEQTSGADLRSRPPEQTSGAETRPPEQTLGPDHLK